MRKEFIELNEMLQFLDDLAVIKYEERSECNNKLNKANYFLKCFVKK